MIIKTAIQNGASQENNTAAIKVNQAKKPGKISKNRYKNLSIGLSKSRAEERLR